ncbi:MAG: hypothetical protein ACTHZ9_07185 [Leucobacter sp.]
MNTITSVVRWLEDTEFDPDSVTPGAIGFIMTGVFALAVILLGFNLVRRLRRNAYRSEIRDSLQAEIDERDASGRSADRSAERTATSGDEDPVVDTTSGSGAERSDGRDGSDQVDGDSGDEQSPRN